MNACPLYSSTVQQPNRNVVPFAACFTTQPISSLQIQLGTKMDSQKEGNLRVRSSGLADNLGQKAPLGAVKTAVQVVVTTKSHLLVHLYSLQAIQQ